MRFNYFLVIVVVLGALLAGCGGGGGGGPVSNSVLSYTTDWSGRGNTGQITGLSQRIVLTGPGGTVSGLMNQDKEGLQTVDIPVSSSGEYHLQVTLYSLRDAGGVSTGTIDADLVVGGTTSYTTAVGEQPTGIKVTPSAKTVTAPEGATYYAAATGPSGRPTFTTSNQFAWSLLGGVGTIDQSGIVSTSNAGTGTVRAQYTPSGVTGSASITVNSPNVTTGKWTVLVYMNAANDLSQFDKLNINQMEQVASNPNVRFVVQWKQAYGYWDDNPEFVGTRRYLIQQDSTTSVASKLIQDMGTGVDMGDPQTLYDFTRWAKTYYPAERYCVVIWNHGNGWERSLPVTRGVSYDFETNNHIDTWQLAQALGGTKWDIVSWDSSLMQMMEVAYEIKDVAKYVVGSEESPPGEGLPYDTIFAKFRDNPDASTRELTNAFVQGMVNDPNYTSRKITQSSIDTSQLDALRDKLSTLATALTAHKSELGTSMQTVRNTTKGYSLNASRYYYDIGDLCDKINANVSFADVNSAATAVKSALLSAVAYEGHNANSAGSTGLSINFQDAATFQMADGYGSTFAQDYAQLRFGQESTWRDWLSVAP